jgi:hypothetical protein
MSLQLRPILIAAFLGGIAVTAAAETPRTSQIYLQRGADGRSVLTDRPSASAVTERTWQMDREDPVAAQQRALEVQRQAEAVSIRVQRSIETQQRLASEENYARLRLAQQSAPAGDFDDDQAVVFAPLGFGPLGRRFDHRHPPHRPHAQPRRGPFMRSALPGSR